MVAERLREKVSSEPVGVGGGHKPLRVTVSLGISCASGPEDTTQALLDQADKHSLYASKRHGRNRTMFPGVKDQEPDMITKRDDPTG
jgi:diguanylate cyclase (GGDEF)-like protein